MAERITVSDARNIIASIRGIALLLNYDEAREISIVILKAACRLEREAENG